MNSLSLLVSVIRLAFSRNENVVGVFLDVCSAYDSVDLLLLRDKMLRLNLPSRIINIICDMFMKLSILIRFPNYNKPPRLI